MNIIRLLKIASLLHASLRVTHVLSDPQLVATRKEGESLFITLEIPRVNVQIQN